MRAVTHRRAHADGVQVLSGSVGGTSDFVFRGLSLTRGKPAAQASLDIEFPREYYVGGIRGDRRSEPRSQPGRGNGFLGRPLLAHVGKLLRRPAPLAVHLPRRSAARQLQPHRAHRHAGLSQPVVSSRLSTRPTPRPSARLRDTTKATSGPSNSPAASRSTSACRCRPASGHYGLRRGLSTTATTTGTSR